MFKKGSKLYSISKFKCPQCHEGDLYKSSIIEGIYNMHEECTECNQSFEIEPGFYIGAMYIGYALNSGYMLIGMVLAIFLLDFSVNQSLLLVIFGGVFIMPWVARLARAIWINICVRYNKNAVKNYRVH